MTRSAPTDIPMIIPMLRWVEEGAGWDIATGEAAGELKETELAVDAITVVKPIEEGVESRSLLVENPLADVVVATMREGDPGKESEELKSVERDGDANVEVNGGGPPNVVELGITVLVVEVDVKGPVVIVVTGNDTVSV